MEREKKKSWSWCIYMAVIVVLFLLTVSTAKFDHICKYTKNANKVSQIPLMDGQVLEQDFVCAQDVMAGIDIYLINNNADEDVLLNVELYDGDTLLVNWGLRGDEIKSEKFAHFILPEKLSGMAGKALRIKMTSDAKDASSHLFVGTVVSSEELEKIDVYGGELEDEIICMRTFYKYISKNMVAGLTILAAAVIMSVAIVIGRIRMKQEKRYLFLSLVVGSVFLIVLPYTKVPDEGNHYLRIFEITEGHMISDKNDEGTGGQYLPKMDYADVNAQKSTYSDIWSASDKTVNYGEERWYSFSNTSLYAPVSYLPQLIGVMIGKLIFATTFGISLMGKIFAMLCSVIMVYFSVKYIPMKKLSIVMLAMTPMFLQESVSMAADCFINALCMLAISYALYLAYGEKKALSRFDLSFIYVSVILIALCKIVYLPICAIYFIIPKEKFGSAKKYWGILGSACGIAVIANLIWLSISTGYLIEFNEGVDSAEQVAYVLSHPITFIQTTYRTVKASGLNWLMMFLGSNLAWLEVGVSSIFLVIYAALILISSVTMEKDEIIIYKKDKYIAGGICLAVTALIFASLYVQWTPVGEDVINGIQGRYFIPIAIMLCTMFGSKKFLRRGSRREPYIYPFIGWIEVVSLVAIVQTLL